MLQKEQKDLLDEMQRELLIDEFGYYRLGIKANKYLCAASKRLLEVDLQEDGHFPDCIVADWERMARERLLVYKDWWNWAVEDYQCSDSDSMRNISNEALCRLSEIHIYLSRLDLGKETKADLRLIRLVNAYEFYDRLPYTYSEAFITEFVDSMWRCYLESKNVLTK